METTILLYRPAVNTKCRNQTLKQTYMTEKKFPKGINKNAQKNHKGHKHHNKGKGKNYFIIS